MSRSLPQQLFIIAILFALFCSNTLYGQAFMQPQPYQQYTGAPGAWEPVHNPDIGIPDAKKNQAHAVRKLSDGPNYKTFTQAKKNMSAEAVAANAGYENNPDYGSVYQGAPCSDCYELIGERTETTKTFVQEGTHNGKKVKMTQTSTQPMHYRDAKGNWVTIRTQLAPDANNKGVYSIPDEATPVVINTNADDNFSALGKGDDQIKFNHNLELIYVQADGKEVALGRADYTHHTAGDGGVYVTDAWPGIDIEMNIMRGAIKTNFHVNHALPQYAGGKLLVRDHLLPGKGQSLSAASGTKTAGELTINDNTGMPKYGIGRATIYEQNDHKNTLQPLEYYVGDNNILDIALPGVYLNKPARAYPIIIDPLVTLATTSTVDGSSYITVLTATSGCEYVNPAWTPTNCTVTDIQFAFQYTCNTPMGLEYGGTVFYLGTCRSPGTVAAGYIWSCESALPGTCTATGGTTYSIWGTTGATTSGLGPCVPAPQCTSYELNIDMYFMQSWETTVACATTWCYASQPLVITVVGETVELTAAGVVATPATICAGASSTLTASGAYGVPPYTYTWTPGPLTGSPVVVTPLTTTTYDLTVTDNCGITATGEVTVTVNTVDPITGTTSLCAGTTTTLADGTGGAHTWVSSSTGVATITSPGGIVTAVGAGTTTITYTSTATGCYATIVVTVTPVPGPITGTETVCAGGTTQLSDATAGDTWSSSNVGVATISATGLVTGISTGTSMITYGSATCYVTAIVTVNLLSAITGTLKVCEGSTTTLADAAGAGTWESGTTGVATAGLSTGVVTGVSGGTSIITFTTAAGCSTTAIVTVNPVSPINGTLILCAGSTTTLSDITAGGTWSSSTVTVATIGLTSGLVTAIANGTTTIVYTTAAGCTATAIFTVNALSAITGTLTVCEGSTTTLGDAAAGGTWSSGTMSAATIGLTTGVVTGVSGGTSTIVYTTGAGCTTSAIVTVNPVSPITGTLALCAGSTTTLADAAGGGTWSSSTLTVLTIGLTTGVVTTIANGTSTIVYTTPAGCTATAVVTVNALAGITGTLNVCAGSTITLGDAATGGTWSSGTVSVATIGLTTGVVTGVSGGTSTIVYTTAAGCNVSAIETVNPVAAITGTFAICEGTSTTLADALGGGTWSSTNTTVATIGAGTGVVNGLTAGITTISYILPTGCYSTATFTVNTVAAITGTPALCAGSTTTLNDATTGGTWISNTTSVAIIGLTSGIVSGISAGTSGITYTSGSGCTIAIVVTVYPSPAAISGLTNVCAGLTITLSDITPGGTWSSSNAGIASAGATGVVTGVSAGAATITYKLPGGCYAVLAVIVNPLPNAISGPADVCLGSSITLNDASAGGAWNSSNAAVATIGAATGVVTGIAYGAATITYTLATGCVITTPVTVVPLPTAPGTVNLDYCQGAPADTLTATGSNLLWYTSLTSTAGSATAPLPATSTPGVTTWYVSQTVNGCEGPRAELQVTIHTTPVFNIVAVRPTTCQYDTISYYASGPTFAGETYKWSLPSNGALYSGSSLSNPSITLDFDTVLGFNYVVLTAGDGYAPCNVMDSLPMTVYINSPQATFYLKPNICAGDSVTIALTSIGAGVTDFTWNFDGATIITASSNSGGPFLVTWPTAGTYIVALTAISNLNCPSVPILDTVDVHPLPDATFTFKPKSDNTLCLEDSVEFMATDTAYNDAFLWSPAHSFNNDNKPVIWGKVEETQSDITLTVTDPFGCVAVSTQQLDASACCTVMFPNAFTPNGDGKDDYFRPLFSGFHNFHSFRIVNRWGQTIFESANSLPQWDGTFNGVPQDIGTYYYFIEYDCGGNTVEAKGDVTLIR